MPRGKSFPPSAPLLCFSPYIRFCVQFTFLHFIICTFAHLHICTRPPLTLLLFIQPALCPGKSSQNPTVLPLPAQKIPPTSTSKQYLETGTWFFLMKSEISAEFLRYLCNPRRNQFWQAGVNSQTSPTPKVSRQCVFVLLLRYCSDRVSPQFYQSSNEG